MKKAIVHYGLISKKMRWGLTLWGWLLLLVVILSLIFFLFSRTYGFLAPVAPEQATVLVLEGAVPDYVLEEALKEFENHPYQLLITTGTPLEWGHLLVAYENTARIAEATLKQMGFDSTRLVAVATDEIRNDRTFNSALELGKFLRTHYPDVKAINLMSYGVHARRSQLLFQKAMGDSVRVGIIAVKSYYYGANNWWKSGKGFREVMNELLGYIFVKLFFVPYTLEDEPQDR